LTKIRPVEAELFRADLQRDRHNEVNGSFSPSFQCA